MQARNFAATPESGVLTCRLQLAGRRRSRRFMQVQFSKFYRAMVQPGSTNGEFEWSKLFAKMPPAQEASTTTAAFTCLRNFYSQNGVLSYYAFGVTKATEADFYVYQEANVDEHGTIQLPPDGIKNDAVFRQAATIGELWQNLSIHATTLNNGQKTSFLRDLYNGLVANKTTLAAAIAMDNKRVLKTAESELNHMFQQVDAFLSEYACGYANDEACCRNAMAYNTPLYVNSSNVCFSILELFAKLKHAAHGTIVIEYAGDSLASHTFQILSRLIMQTNEALDKKMPLVILGKLSGTREVLRQNDVPIAGCGLIHNLVVLDACCLPNSSVQVELLVNEVQTMIGQSKLLKPTVMVLLEACAQDILTRLVTTAKSDDATTTLRADLKASLDERGVTLTSFGAADSGKSSSITIAAGLSTVDALSIIGKYGAGLLQSEPLVMPVVVRTVSEIIQFVNQMNALLRSSATTTTAFSIYADNTSNALMFYEQLKLASGCSAVIGWNQPPPLDVIFRTFMRQCEHQQRIVVIPLDKTSKSAVESNPDWKNFRNSLLQPLKPGITTSKLNSIKKHIANAPGFGQGFRPTLTPLIETSSFECANGVSRMRTLTCCRTVCFVIHLSSSSMKMDIGLAVAYRLLASNVPVAILNVVNDDGENVSAESSAIMKTMAAALPFLNVSKANVAAVLGSILHADASSMLMLVMDRSLKDFSNLKVVPAPHGIAAIVTESSFESVEELTKSVSSGIDACFVEKIMVRSYGDKVE